MNKKHITTLGAFIGPAQMKAIMQGMLGEEKQFFFDKMNEVQSIINAMPKIYETDGKKDKIAHLHYFIGSMDFYIVEKDTGTEQYQAFGWADLGYGGELGYISIQELIENGVELDLHFEPKLLSECIK